MPSLSIFFPCYNDAGTIGSMIAAADRVASEFTADYEILAVDDGSSDSSRKLLEELRLKYSKLKLIFHIKNRGYGAAIRSGIASATKDLLFYTDGDGQYDVFELRKLLPIMQDGMDVVNGYKILRHDPFHRVVIGIVYLRLMRLLFNFKLRDIDCDFRLIRRSILEKICLKHDSGVICLELVKKLELAGCRFAKYPVNHYHRSYGRSQFFKFGRLSRTVLNIFSLWWELVILRQTRRPDASSKILDSRTQNPSLV